MFHDRTDNRCLTVGDAVDIDLYSVLEIPVDQYRSFLGCFDGLVHVFPEGLDIVDNDHGTPAQHK